MDTSDDRHWVTRTDASGIRETSGFADTGRGFMALTLSAPAAARLGVVMCPSLFTEALRNYRREALLARAMARAGIAVARPQYRGTGNSDDVEIDRATIVDDARFAAEVLRSHTGVETLAFAGTRLGGLVAATLAGAVPGAPVALVEPVDDARRFLDEGLRAKVISMFKASGKVTKASLVAQLEEAGWIELMGHQLGAPLYRSTEAWRLREVLGPEPRPILLVQLGADQPLRPDYEELVTAWRRDGFEVEAAQSGASRTWWFLHEQIEEGKKIRQTGLDESDEVIELVTSWLGRVAAVGAPR